MAVDAKRIEAVFRAAVEAADPVHRAAILDRECASDTEMRQRVEALLRAHREPATIVDRPTATPLEFAPPSLDITMAFDPSADQKRPIAATPEQDRVTEHEELDEYEEPLALEFLEPSSKPGSLGRLGHHEVLEVLGRGGFGIVVRAFDETLHRMVAIKVLVAATGVDLAGAQALSARGPRLRPHPARQRRPDLRRRGAAAALPGHGVHPGPDLAAEARPDRPAGSGGRAPHRRADRPRTGRRPRARSDPPRHQAGQHPAGKRHRAERQDHRLRPGPGGRRRQPDAVGRDRRHAAVHGAGAGQGRDRSTPAPTCSASAACCTRWRAAGRRSAPPPRWRC